jgi:hypothetical protein
MKGGKPLGTFSGDIEIKPAHQDLTIESIIEGQSKAYSPSSKPVSGAVSPGTGTEYYRNYPQKMTAEMGQPLPPPTAIVPPPVWRPDMTYEHWLAAQAQYHASLPKPPIMSGDLPTGTLGHPALPPQPVFEPSFPYN